MGIMAICTRDDVKVYLELKDIDTTKDHLIDKLIPKAQNFIESFYYNQILEQAPYIEYYDGPRSAVFVRNPPIASSPAPIIHDDPDRDFDTATLVETDDYGIDYEAGIIKFEYPLCKGIRSVKVEYTGGYVAAALPGIAVQAVIELVVRKIKDGAEGRLGVASRSSEAGTVTFTREDLPQSTRDALERILNVG